MILILDFGGQYTQLIARRVRELHVYCEIHPFDLPLEALRRLAPEGIVLSGGPASVYDPDAPQPLPAVLEALDATIWIPAGARAEVDESGSVLVHVGGADPL